MVFCQCLGSIRFWIQHCDFLRIVHWRVLLLSILSWRSIIPRKIYLPRQKTEQIGWWWHWTTAGSKTTNCDGESRVGLHLWSANCSNHMEAIGRIAILHYLSAPWKPEERSLLVKSLFQCLVVFGRSHRHLVKRVNLNLFTVEAPPVTADKLRVLTGIVPVSRATQSWQQHDSREDGHRESRRKFSEKQFESNSNCGRLGLKLANSIWLAGTSLHILDFSWFIYYN